MSECISYTGLVEEGRKAFWNDVLIIPSSTNPRQILCSDSVSISIFSGNPLTLFIRIIFRMVAMGLWTSLECHKSYSSGYSLLKTAHIFRQLARRHKTHMSCRYMELKVVYPGVQLSYRDICLSQRRQ